MDALGRISIDRGSLWKKASGQITIASKGEFEVELDGDKVVDVATGEKPQVTPPSRLMQEGKPAIVLSAPPNAAALAQDPLMRRCDLPGDDGGSDDDDSDTDGNETDIGDDGDDSDTNRTDEDETPDHGNLSVHQLQRWKKDWRRGPPFSIHVKTRELLSAGLELGIELRTPQPGARYHPGPRIARPAPLLEQNRSPDVQKAPDYSNLEGEDEDNVLIPDVTPVRPSGQRLRAVLGSPLLRKPF
ncbi:hypothetical protein QBC45DRAFT_392059 [Copromyces sp. CBS 386.78]|nr:hypothetical protein QBC45DRAFT_392059 [Copromyces sp. CBS 386.78]